MDEGAEVGRPVLRQGLVDRVRVRDLDLNERAGAVAGRVRAAPRQGGRRERQRDNDHEQQAPHAAQSARDS